jgi:tRNA threonylcarbamoyl adenosine modification protein YeaZ
MNILCLNTAFPEAHIALSFLNKEYFQIIDSNCKHSENLLVAVESLLEKATHDLQVKTNSAVNKSQLNQQNTTQKITAKDMLEKIDAISVVVGPGSFTGLRISIATAKALMLTNPNMKAVAINSLELMAAEFYTKSNLKTSISPIINALSGFLFMAEFDKDLNCEQSPEMIDGSQIINLKNLVSLKHENLTTKTVELHPSTLLHLTQSKINAQNFITENELIPLYIRPSQAEANLIKTQDITKKKENTNK